MPRFRLEYQVLLNDTLKALGMEIAFIPGIANLSGIAPLLYIEKVIHKTFLEVNEEGTEAAAVTLVGPPPASGPETLCCKIVPFSSLFMIIGRTQYCFMGNCRRTDVDCQISSLNYRGHCMRRMRLQNYRTAIVGMMLLCLFGCFDINFCKKHHW